MMTSVFIHAIKRQSSQLSSVLKVICPAVTLSTLCAVSKSDAVYFRITRQKLADFDYIFGAQNPGEICDLWF